MTYDKQHFAITMSSSVRATRRIYLPRRNGRMLYDMDVSLGFVVAHPAAIAGRYEIVQCKDGKQNDLFYIKGLCAAMVKAGLAQDGMVAFTMKPGGWSVSIQEKNQRGSSQRSRTKKAAGSIGINERNPIAQFLLDTLETTPSGLAAALSTLQGESFSKWSNYFRSKADTSYRAINSKAIADVQSNIVELLTLVAQREQSGKSRFAPGQKRPSTYGLDRLSEDYVSKIKERIAKFDANEDKAAL